MEYTANPIPEIVFCVIRGDTEYVPIPRRSCDKLLCTLNSILHNGKILRMREIVWIDQRRVKGVRTIDSDIPAYCQSFISVGKERQGTNVRDRGQRPATVIDKKFPGGGDGDKMPF